jgi:hypothetical protein
MAKKKKPAEKRPEDQNEGYHGSIDNQGGNFNQRQAEEQARRQLDENNGNKTDEVER